MQGLIYSTAKPGQLGIAVQILWGPLKFYGQSGKKGEASKKGTKLRFAQELQLKLIKLLKFIYSEKAERELVLDISKDLFF